MGASFRLAHLSDLHLTAEDGAARSEPKLWGRLRGMNQRLRALFRSSAELRGCDRILVTGDVSDRGHMAAWEVLRDAASAAGVADKLIVIAGNHDVCCLGIRDRPRAEDRARARAGLAMLGQGASYPSVVTLVPAGVDLFLLDSTNAANLSGATNAVGVIGENQLIKLARLLEERRHVPVKLVALHHSPNIAARRTSLRRGQRPMGFAGRKLHELAAGDRRTLRVLCRAWGVKAILHGHTHDDLDRRVNGVRMIGAPATTQPDAAGAMRFKRYTIDVGANRLRAETLAVPPR